MVFGILFVGVAVFIIIQAVIRNGSSSNRSTFDRNRQNDAANMSFMAASHPDLLDPNHSNHHHHHPGDHSHHHSGPDSGHSWGGDGGHSAGGDGGGGGDAGGGGCD
ncbi:MULTISPECIES: hypothetical protein [Paenibacillus]|uniref:Uncharacterized protein n=1 Tax=Paenibacillus odorifer TaxID=189426 RepID=A0A1R0XDA9_9BACL|nr:MULTISPECIES: hypothetical protein [Paenibacillus]ETT69009.1 hypothetical protein C171_00510 [Paenibacillus sp. FSL H8-237]OMD33036.1 hypothetical protein BJP51_13850 [Paenibacillus odorifer]OME33364.1 hypothetical protein BSK58_26980 [Paenibacillus odorifer]OME45733.1 hypothetical protein BSK61_29635 [Paenibacillus odorifer]OME58870.1 hypothetical protein BSK66_12130 [Paenibacillus odorifer]